MGSAVQWWREGTGGVGPPPPPPPGSMQPSPAYLLRNGLGFCAQPSRNDMNYSATAAGVYDLAHTRAYLEAAKDMGATFIRGLYTPGNQGTINTANECRRLGLRWLMILTHETNDVSSDTASTVAAKVAHAGSNNADICWGFEGPNEPNDNRGTAPPPVPADWAAKTIVLQKAIWDAAAAINWPHPITILSPSMHDVANQNSYSSAAVTNLVTKSGAGGTLAKLVQKDPVNNVGALPSSGNAQGHVRQIFGGDAQYVWTGSAWAGPVALQGGVKHLKQMVDRGVKTMCDVVGQHSYASAGGVPMTAFDKRAGYVDAEFGTSYPMVVSEWGYSTAIKSTLGHAICTEKAQGIYIPRGLLEFFEGYGQVNPRKHVPLGIFEMLDAYNPAADSVEDLFGVIGVGQASVAASYDITTYRYKPAATALKAMMAATAEPAGNETYIPAMVALKIDTGSLTNIRNSLIGFRDGTVKLWLWQDASVMNTKTKVDVTVPDVNVNLIDNGGTRTVKVGPDCRVFTIRR